MKKSTRFLSLLLSIVMILSILPVTSLAADENTVKRYTVLVLDTSSSATFTSGGEEIYTANTAISYVKKAANSFFSSLINADGTNYVAVVSFKSTATTVSDFSTDINALNNKVNNLTASDGVRDISAGLEKANSLLSSIADGENVKKNVVLFTTGMTNNGEYDYNGKYDEGTIGSDWYRTNTGIHLYAYANHAISVAENVKKQATLYTIGLFQTMEGMPDEGKDVVEFFKLTACDVATSEEYFYQVDDPEKLEITFGEVADVIVEPVSIDLDDVELVEEDDSQATYMVYASVKNNSDKVAITNVKGFFFADNTIILEGEEVQTIQQIEAGKTSIFRWEIQIDKTPFTDGGIYRFHVSVGSDQTVTITQEGIIHFEATNQQSNELNFTNDVWNFRNFSDTNCPITDTDLNALLSGFSPSEQENIQGWLKAPDCIGNGGHCYGMSALVILNKMNAIDLSEFTGENTVRAAALNRNGTHSIICYWQVTQKFDLPQACMQYYLNLPTVDQLAQLSRKADAVKNGGCPILFCFGVDGWGAHAVVAYALEPGSFTSSASGRTYNRRVLLYDCNVVDWDEDNCLLFNEGTDEWEIPYYFTCEVEDGTNWLGMPKYKTMPGATSTNSEAYLMSCQSTINTIDVKDYDAGLFNYHAELICKNQTNLRLQNTKNDKWIIHGKSNGIEGDKKLLYYNDIGTIDSGGIGALNIVLPDENDRYTVETEDSNSGELNLSIKYDDEYLSIKADSANGMKFGDHETVTLLGNNGSYTVTIADDTIPSGKFNIYEFSGNNEGDTSFTMTNDGVVISGDDLSSLVIEAREGNEEDQIVIGSDDNTVIVGQDHSKLYIVGGFRIDFDANGGTVFPAVIATGSNGILELMPTPTRSGYTFDGWFTAAVGGTQVNTSTVFTANTTVYAHWTKQNDSPYVPYLPIIPIRPITPVTPAEPVTPVVEEKAELPFIDVKQTDDFYDDVAYVYDNDLMIGVSDTLFAPYTTLSRGMIVTILYRLEGEPAFMNDNIFTDVEADSWYEKAVVWANGKGIVLGYGDGRFGPTDPVTREQMAAILYRYAQYKGYDVSIDENTNFLSFDDVFNIDEWAQNPIFWALDNDLIEDENGWLYPRDNATRAVVATFLHRFCEEFVK